MLPDNAALVIIDVQEGLDDSRYWGGQRNNPEAEAEISRLLAAWRERGRPVVHVQHASTNPRSPLHPEHPGHTIKRVAAPFPGEPLLRKSTNSAFVGTHLQELLRGAGITTLVLAGVSTDHCVSATARMAKDLGFRTIVVSDATATFPRTGHDGRRWEAEVVHAVSLASLRREFAAVVDSKAILEAISR